MPTWVYGIAMGALFILRPRILAWLFGFVLREIGSLLRVSKDEQLQRDAAAWRRSRSSTNDTQAS
jgi:hypothetical protein